ncbi:helix-turn-helix domain-containing protein [Mycobacterium sp.]|uniref:TetR/AcrR family transcriptional regulator n=1 Tax=Mycobacterium sp. TaxID=1785 RepID=UPI002CDCA039|nr:helix-turn-helix domain-containing protein [Mycobacterium sp.]HTQ21318.1 helix-turn-helix domain-containing protein [Mycobacterium sp.]
MTADEGDSAHRLRSITRTPTQLRTLNAALALFAEHGVSGTSLKMIAEATGVTKAAIFYQFKTKDDLVLAVAEMELVPLEEAVERAERQTSRARARDALLREVIDMAVDRRHFVSALQNDPVMIRMLANHEPLAELMERAYALILQDGRLRSRVRIAIMGAMIGAAVVHPLVANIDDKTLRRELRSATRRLYGINV